MCALSYLPSNLKEQYTCNKLKMSTDLSKSDEVNDSLDSILNMDEGEDNILGQTFIGDLLDKDDGADIGGNQSETQSATEEGTREQPHSAIDSLSGKLKGELYKQRHPRTSATQQH